MSDAETPPALEKKGQIRPRLARALELIVHKGLSITKAAEEAGLRRESLQVALKKPHVRARLADVKRAWMESETFVAWGTVVELARGAASEDVRLKAARTILESSGELTRESRGDRPQNIQGVQIIITPAGGGPAATTSNGSGVFEAAPYSPPEVCRD